MSRTARENILTKSVTKSHAASSAKPSGKAPGRGVSATATKPETKPASKLTGKSAASLPSQSAAGASKRSRAATAALATPVATVASPRSRTRSAAAIVPPIEVAKRSVPAKSAKADAAPRVRAVAKSTASAAAATRAASGRNSLAPAKPLPLSQRPIDQVWREYRVTPTEEVRNFLIGRHLDLVAYAAERLHKRLPSEVEINDLKSAGAFGLMDAVESFDPDRGVKFETYCTQRIRGAMFDELRSMDWVPRLVRSRTAKVEKVRKSIEMETGARPTEDEVAARLNVSGDEFEKLQKDSRPISMVSLTRKCFETDSSKDVREIDVVEDGRQENPLQAVQKQDLQALITKGLNRAERLIVILYYYEEMTMKEIGATLDLSESRVSQMHSSILARLKAQMQHRENTEE